MIDLALISQEAGIRDGTIRVAVGIEDIDDLIADFRQALQAIGKSKVRALSNCMPLSRWCTF